MNYSHHCLYYLRNQLITRSTFWPPLPNSLAPHLPLLINENQISVSLVWFSVHLFMDSTFKWYYTISVFVWLILLSIMPSKSIHVVANGNAFLCITKYCSTVCVFISYFLYPFIHWWKPGLFSHFDYCE